MLRVWVDIRTTPTEIARSVFECREHTASIRDLADARVCLRVHESPRTRLSESSLAQDSRLLPCPVPTWGVPGSLSPPHPLLPPIGNLQSDVTFDLTLDPGRLSPRAIFKETNTRHLTRVRLLDLRQHCEEVKLLLPVRVLGAGDGVVLRLAVAGQGKNQCVLVLASPRMQEELNMS